jgi:hypothetical protein
MELAMRKAGFPILRILSVLAAAALSCSLPDSFLNSDPDESSGKTEIWQVEVDAINAMTRTQPIPNFLIDPQANQNGKLFEPNQLLIPLDHLSLQPGYTLDFVYRYDGIGGKPFLYARKQTDLPFENYEAFIEADLEDHQYLDFIACDGTDESYFQWVLLSMMGDQFYLYWHAGYQDEEIIASKARLNALVMEMSTTEIGTSISNSQKREALKVDPAPVIEVGDQNVLVRVVWFSKWGGFFESTYTLSRLAPHQIQDLEIKNLIEYDCGILF